MLRDRGIKKEERLPKVTADQDAPAVKAGLLS